MSIVDYFFWFSLVILATGLLAWWVAGLKRWMRENPAVRVNPVILVRARAPLPPEDLARILAGWESTDERRQALEDILDLCFAEHLADIERRGTPADERAYAAGALASLRHFDARLREYGQKRPEPKGPAGPEYGKRATG